MTSNVIALDEMTPSAYIAREIRVELARQERTQSWLAMQLGKNNTWVSARISRKNIRTVDLTVEEISGIAKALNVPVERLLFGWLTDVGSDSARLQGFEPRTFCSVVLLRPALSIVKGGLTAESRPSDVPTRHLSVVAAAS